MPAMAGRPVFVYNMLNLERFRWEGGIGGGDVAGSALKPGKHTIVFDFKIDGPGLGKGGTGVLSVDGRQVAKKSMPHVIPMLMAIDETFDIGSDTRTGVDDSYKLPFRFTGTIDNLVYDLKPETLSEDDKAKQRASFAKAKFN